MTQTEPTPNASAPEWLIACEDALFARALAGHLPAPAAMRHIATPETDTLAAAKTPSPTSYSQRLLVLLDSRFNADFVQRYLRHTPMPCLILTPPGYHPSALPEQCLLLPRPFAIDALQPLLAIMAHQQTRIDWPNVGYFDAARMVLGPLKADEIALTERETELLCYFITYAGPVMRQTLLTELWGHQAELETHTLETHLSRLRAKLKDAFGDHLTITHQDEGYALVIRISLDAT
jgi:hypothetical protein